MDANTLAQTIRDRIAAGGDLLESGQWLEEVLIRGRPDGTVGAHVVIGQETGLGVIITPALPIDLVAGATGIPAADVMGQAAIVAAADRDAEKARADAAEAERDAEKARADQAEADLAAEKARNSAEAQ